MLLKAYEKEKLTYIVPLEEEVVTTETDIQSPGFTATFSESALILDDPTLYSPKVQLTGETTDGNHSFRIPLPPNPVRH